VVDDAAMVVGDAAMVADDAAELVAGDWGATGERAAGD
jgi:hypothetical protein